VKVRETGKGGPRHKIKGKRRGYLCFELGRKPFGRKGSSIVTSAEQKERRRKRESKKRKETIRPVEKREELGRQESGKGRCITFTGIRGGE